MACIYIKDSTGVTRWPVYILSNILTFFGVCFALGLVGKNENIVLSPSAISFGLLVSLMAFLYFIAGRWLFFSRNTPERCALYRLSGNTVYINFLNTLEKDEVIVVANQSEMHTSLQKTLFQSFGMVFIGCCYIPLSGDYLISMLEPDALVSGLLLGAVCLALAFFLITYADSVPVYYSNKSIGRLDVKIKGISQQLELIITISVGYLILNEQIGLHGLLGCAVLISSYVIGVLFSERL